MRALLRLPANTWQLRLSSPGRKCSEAAHEWPGVGMVSGPGGLHLLGVGLRSAGSWGPGGGGGWVSGSSGWFLVAPRTASSKSSIHLLLGRKREVWWLISRTEQRLPPTPSQSCRPFARTCPEDPAQWGQPPVQF